MKTWQMIVLVLGFSLLALGAYATFTPKEALCTWCPSYSCYGGGCGSGCVCVTGPGQFSGKCYGID